MKYLPDIRPFVRRLRNSRGFHNTIVFLGFVVIAAIFWIVMAMNDSAQGDFLMRVQVENVPDSVTFIQEPPQTIHVAVRDRGTSLFRAGGFREPELKLNFRDFAQNGYFRLTPSDLDASIKAVFGKSASILSVSVDSLRLAFTTSKGKMVPVVVNAQIEAAPGNIVVGTAELQPSRVRIYGPQSILDTVNRVFAERVVMNNLKESGMTTTDIIQIPGTRTIPARVTVSAKAEPLVRKETEVPIKAINVPDGISLMLFPARAKVSYYVPMSRFSDEVTDISVIVDYNSVSTSRSLKLPIYIGNVPSVLQNPDLNVDSVEYSVVR